MRILDWHEHLTHKEVPPEWMWPLDEEIANWLKRVTERRNEKLGISSDDDEDLNPHQRSGSLTGNDLTAGRGRNS